MATPVLNGILASSSGAAADARQGPTFIGSGSFVDLSSLGSVGIGLIAAVLILAYWYRRVL